MQNLQAKAEAIAKLIAIDESSKQNISLLYIALNINEVVECLSQYIRFIDYYSLKRVSEYFSLPIWNKFYKLDTLVDIRIKDKNLFDLADETNTVISGSFILKILLSTPYQMPLWITHKSNVYNKYHSIPPDIDLYSHPITVSCCPTCLSSDRNIISKISTYLCNGLSTHFVPGATEINIWHDYNDTLKNLVECNDCKVNNILFNDIIVSENVPLNDFIIQEFDFDFLKNYYMDSKIYVKHPETVLKRKCIFRIKYYNEKSEMTKQLITIDDRYLKYTKRRFNIILQVTKEVKAKLIKYSNSNIYAINRSMLANAVIVE